VDVAHFRFRQRYVLGLFSGVDLVDESGVKFRGSFIDDFPGGAVRRDVAGAAVQSYYGGGDGGGADDYICVFAVELEYVC